MVSQLEYRVDEARVCLMPMKSDIVSYATFDCAAWKKLMTSELWPSFKEIRSCYRKILENAQPKRRYDSQNEA